MKTITAFMLLAYCGMLYQQSPSNYALMILIAIAFGVAGDVLLIGKSSRFFLAGMLAFAIGHIVYTLAFWQLSLRWVEWLAGAIPLTVALFAVYRWLSPFLKGTMAFAVPVYMIILGAMCSTAISVRSDGQLTIIALGGVMFLVSDLFVAMYRFKQPRFHDKLIGLPLYFGAQFILATSIIGLTTNSPWLPV